MAISPDKTQVHQENCKKKLSGEVKQELVKDELVVHKTTMSRVGNTETEAVNREFGAETLDLELEKPKSKKLYYYPDARQPDWAAHAIEPEKVESIGINLCERVCQFSAFQVPSRLSLYFGTESDFSGRYSLDRSTCVLALGYCYPVYFKKSSKVTTCNADEVYYTLSYHRDNRVVKPLKYVWKVAKWVGKSWAGWAARVSDTGVCDAMVNPVFLVFRDWEVNLSLRDGLQTSCPTTEAGEEWCKGNSIIRDFEDTNATLMAIMRGEKYYKGVTSYPVL